MAVPSGRRSGYRADHRAGVLFRNYQLRDHVATSRSQFLFGGTPLLGSLSSFSVCCHSLPSNFCGHVNAAAFFWCQNKARINANVSILPALALCDYARWRLSFNASAELRVQSASFPGEDACRRRNVAPFPWSFVRRVAVVLWQRFPGLRFSLSRSERWGDVRRPGIAPALPAERPCLDASPRCQARSEKARVQALPNRDEGRLEVFSSAPFTLREVLGSVFQFNSHWRVAAAVFISWRWPNAMKYRRLKTRSSASVRPLFGKLDRSSWECLTFPFSSNSFNIKTV